MSLHEVQNSWKRSLPSPSASRPSRQALTMVPKLRWRKAMKLSTTAWLASTVCFLFISRGVKESTWSTARRSRPTSSSSSMEMSCSPPTSNMRNKALACRRSQPNFCNSWQKWSNKQNPESVGSKTCSHKSSSVMSRLWKKSRNSLMLLQVSGESAANPMVIASLSKASSGASIMASKAAPAFASKRGVEPRPAATQFTLYSFFKSTFQRRRKLPVNPMTRPPRTRSPKHTRPVPRTSRARRQAP
mmetsp:Transcript_73318/g.238625  ORF Transcript_73318/g.238625 Transcript_73318/m.238625 type:complete len:245 (+) Transcript_73318:1713-2447(+)